MFWVEKEKRGSVRVVLFVLSVYFVNVRAGVERRNRTVRRCRNELSDFLCSAIAGNEYTLARRRAVFVRNDIARFVEFDDVCKSGVVGHLTYADKSAFCLDGYVLVSLGVFKAKRAEFVLSDKLFESEIVRVSYVGTSKHEIQKCFVAEEFVKQSADMHALAISAQNERVLKSGVGVAYHANVFARIERAVAKSAVTYAAANQFVLALNADFAGFYTRCQNHGFALVCVVIGG